MRSQAELGNEVLFELGNEVLFELGNEVLVDAVAFSVIPAQAGIQECR